MNYLHKTLDLSAGDVVEVTLDHPANVQLLDASNYAAYQAGQFYRYHGGHFTHSPARIDAPSDGRWHLVIDLGGGVGRVSASVSVLSPAHA
jgi:hypothetical protein